jgi:hypothetical protein
VTAGGLTAAIIVAGCTLTCRPRWYQPASIDYTRLKMDKQDLVNLLDSIGASLNCGEAVELEFGQDQVNRWITARAEIWPDHQAAALEPLRHPQVAFLDRNRLLVAATVEWSGLEPVVSCVCRFELDEGQLSVFCDGLRVGMLPVPAAWLAGPLNELATAFDSPTAASVDRGFVFPNEWVWPNGKRRFRIRRLDVSAGQAGIALEPIQLQR